MNMSDVEERLARHAACPACGVGGDHTNEPFGPSYLHDELQRLGADEWDGERLGSVNAVIAAALIDVSALLADLNETLAVLATPYHTCGEGKGRG